MQFSDRIRTENSVYDSYKPYGSTSRCDPFAVPLMRYNFPIVYDRKLSVTISQTVRIIGCYAYQLIVIVVNYNSLIVHH